MPFGEKKARAQEILAAAFSLDYLTVVEYEDRVQQLEAADTFESVDTLVADLPDSLLPATNRSGPVAPFGDVQVLEGRGQVLRRRGRWLRSNRLVVRQDGAVVRLRLDDLAELPNASIQVELDVRG